MDASIQPHSLQPSSFFKVQERDLVAELLRDKRSPETRRAYAKDLKDFFKSISGHEPNPQLVAEFLKLERATAISLVLQYKAGLIERNLAEATINRRLAAIKSLVKFAQKVDKCQWSLEEIDGEKVQHYRDTSGVERDIYSQILSSVDRSSLLGLRNYAILILLWSNALRRGELVKCDVKDFDQQGARLQILGKGRGTQAEWVSLNSGTVDAIAQWLAARFQPSPFTLHPSDPLFISLSNNSPGKRITGNAIYNLVVEASVAAGVQKHLSPHRIRHSSVTAALDATGGDVRRVKKLSRHKRIETLMVYDDNRINHQRDLTDLLGDML
ncbi:MAG: tyrosine-type recombinase/integrase [Oculatellaceae cyanobacterium bins.114]|nr:tyrosine-type recombinase/integrase [Oculatellaceae cyanobacterium bins.114]